MTALNPICVQHVWAGRVEVVVKGGGGEGGCLCGQHCKNLLLVQLVPLLRCILANSKFEVQL